ncbi:MAG: hypothetical protein FWG85_02190 [Bacteroidetes bacterium]|nr:hypothetical protein [Bacteroidota bacterium]
MATLFVVSCKTAVTKDDTEINISLFSDENNSYQTHNPENDAKTQCYNKELEKLIKAKGELPTDADRKAIALKCGFSAFRTSKETKHYYSPSEYEMLYVYPNPTSGNVTIGLGKNFSFSEVKDDTHLELYYKGTKN